MTSWELQVEARAADREGRAGGVVVAEEEVEEEEVEEEEVVVAAEGSSLSRAVVSNM